MRNNLDRNHWCFPQATKNKLLSLPTPETKQKAKLKGLYYFTFQPAIYERSFLSIISSTKCAVKLIDFCQLDRWEMLFQYSLHNMSFSMHEFKHLFICLKAMCISPFVHAYCPLGGGGIFVCFFVLFCVFVFKFYKRWQSLAASLFSAMTKIFHAHVISFLPQTGIKHFSKEFMLL